MRRTAAVVDAIVRIAASIGALVAAAALIVVWAISGFFLGFSDLWQLSINTGTTIVTFLLGFAILHSQNRDTKALHVKLDALAADSREVRDDVVGVERMDEAEVDAVAARVRDDVRTRDA